MEASKTLDSVFCPIVANSFNDLIDNLGVVDVSMVGKRFTRIDTMGAKLSKVDRFLV